MLPLLTGGQKTTKLSRSTNSTIHSRRSGRQLRYQERPKTQFTADIQTDSRAVIRHAPKYNSPKTFTQTADLSNTPQSTIHCRHSHRQPTYQTRPKVQFTADIHTDSRLIKHAPKYNSLQTLRQTADLSNTPKSTIHCRHSDRQPCSQGRPHDASSATIASSRQAEQGVVDGGP